MHELAGAERNTDVRGAAAHRFEEDQIPGAHLIPIDTFAVFVLVSRFAGKRCAVPGEHPLDEPAAVEAASRFTPSVQIRGPAKGERCRNQRRSGAFSFGR